MDQQHVSIVKKIVIAGRPWSFPASVMPVIFGTVLAVTYGGAQFKPLLFLMALAGMVILHAGSNVLGDINDFRLGLDTEVTPVSGAIVRRYFDERMGLWVALAMFAVGCAIGLVIVYLVGIEILYIGIVGVAIGGFYSVPPFALKYHALGDFAVFMDFGILGCLGAWTVQTGHISVVPVIWAIPMAMLIAGILHGNNWRDIQTDTQGHISTIASLLGDERSQTYYGFLIFGPFVFVVLTIMLTRLFECQTTMPWTCLLTLGALPFSVRLWKRARSRKNPERPEDFVLLDKSTASLNIIFGSLYTVSLVLGKLVR